MIDKGFQNNKLWLVTQKKPETNVIETLSLDYDDTTQEWFTSLDDLRDKNVEIISITPYEHEQVGRKTIIKNLYILKIEDPDCPIE